MPKVTPEMAPYAEGTNYPPPHDGPVKARRRWRLGEAGGLTTFGVNRLELDPGVWSSQRHWHTHEDEFVVVLEGEVVLVDDSGETVLRAGDTAAFKAGVPNGHQLINRGDRMAVVLEIGGRDELDGCDYPDIDMIAPPGDSGYRHRDGTPY